MVHCDGDIAAHHGATCSWESVTRGTVVRDFMRMRSRSVRTPDRVEQDGNRRERHGGLPDDR